MKFLSAATISLVAEARSGPFVFHGDLRRGCAQAAKLGFDAVEIFPASADVVSVIELRVLLKRHHLKVAAVGTGAGWLKHRWTLTSPDPLIRNKARKFIEQLIDFAAAFNAPAIIGSMQGRVEADVNRRQSEQWLAEGLKALGERAGKRSVSLLYEPLNRYETNLFNRAEDAAAFLVRRKIRHVKLLCDLFHMNIEEKSIPDTLRAVARQLGHVHFADTNRRAIGFGHLDVKSIIETLREIGYAGYLSAEVLPLPTSEAAARQTMRAFRKFNTAD
ncbi:MAG: sugar phosphate isomerase/epimerase [Verrucomicrobia bacterium]|nr:sugar phosphate isomerase/epimerase [Verrucomicrobiota bacterium]